MVWGDGVKTDRQIISATDLPPFGKHHFQIPFDATGKKWVRFAAWDSAGNGAMVQPVKLQRHGLRRPAVEPLCRRSAALQSGRASGLKAEPYA